MIYLNKISSHIGEFTVASDGENLIGLWINGQKYYMNGIEKNSCRIVSLPIFEKTREWLEGYFDGRAPDPKTLALSPRGSVFAREIWSMLMDIPYGTVRTYGDLAREYADRHGLRHMSAQAVGGAVSHNPISIIIPCHRVVGINGKLTGYAAGIDIKSQLLHLERGDAFEKQSTIRP